MSIFIVTVTKANSVNIAYTLVARLNKQGQCWCGRVCACVCVCVSGRGNEGSLHVAFICSSKADGARSALESLHIRVHLSVSITGATDKSYSRQPVGRRPCHPKGEKVNSKLSVSQRMMATWLLPWFICARSKCTSRGGDERGVKRNSAMFHIWNANRQRKPLCVLCAQKMELWSFTSKCLARTSTEVQSHCLKSFFNGCLLQVLVGCRIHLQLICASDSVLWNLRCMTATMLEIIKQSSTRRSKFVDLEGS